MTTNTILFHSNGLGEPLSTDWQPMDAPVGPTLYEAGPNGWMEFHTSMTAPRSGLAAGRRRRDA